MASPAHKLAPRRSGDFGYDLDRTDDAIRPHYRFNKTCQQTVPEALVCALESRDLEDAVRNVLPFFVQQALLNLPPDMQRTLKMLYGRAKQD